MGERLNAGDVYRRSIIDSCYLLSTFRPINFSGRLLALYRFPLQLFFDAIRGISDAIFVDIARGSISLHDYMSSSGTVTWPYNRIKLSQITMPRSGLPWAAKQEAS